MLVDSHCHLDFPDFVADLDGVIGRAAAVGVERMVTISTRVRQFDRLRAIVENREEVWCSVGTHCHHAEEEAEIGTEELLRLAEHPRVVAIGEAGLDFHYDYSPRERQETSFRAHIAAARTSGLPLVIHAREADDEVARVLEEETAIGAFPALLHCFSSGPELARRALALGLSVSFSGILTFKKSEEVRAIARDVPLDRVLVETDSPYLAPAPHRGWRCEPAFVVETARVLADVKGVTLEEISRITTDNFHRLFAKVAPPAA
ncbi:TatD family deoxyribonuclease [Siculibacillus lacustris]|uniref:TatD family deoxyribonuclease n=1 Tax=Siculibacillus lacustris TaxID=1549641 RepID=A0A4Q9VQ84_9HYPH|nr:TatD family hydrolase [Siculibacillus lacustris]TBW37006.1 TatD family deoxyribonuclease [Siculibacillus lacustris]